MPPDIINSQKEVIEALAMAITHSEQGEYAKNEAFVKEKLAQAIANIGRELEARCEKSKQDLDDRMEGGSHVNLLIKSHNEGIDRTLTIIRSITGIAK